MLCVSELRVKCVREEQDAAAIFGESGAFTQSAVGRL
uniref:Uncharacterized protein n=1 Tax=Anguilla anguilla TaxID=7936 RepID=A0A0E9UKM0_ANGAN